MHIYLYILNRISVHIITIIIKIYNQCDVFLKPKSLILFYKNKFLIKLGSHVSL